MVSDLFGRTLQWLQCGVGVGIWLTPTDLLFCTNFSYRVYVDNTNEIGCIVVNASCVFIQSVKTGGGGGTSIV